MFGQNTLVFLNVQGDGYGVIFKNEFKYPRADQPMIMFAAGKRIFFANRDSNELHSFNTKTHKLSTVFRKASLNISGICGSKEHVYILDKNKPDHIQILDSGFHPSVRIKTGLLTIRDCNVCMCLVDTYSLLLPDDIVIGTSFPLGTIRLIERTYEVYGR